MDAKPIDTEEQLCVHEYVDIVVHRFVNTNINIHKNLHIHIQLLIIDNLGGIAIL